MPSGPAITMKKKIEKARETRKGREIFKRPSEIDKAGTRLSESEPKKLAS